MIKGLAYVSTGCDWLAGGFLTHYGVPFPKEKWVFTGNKPLKYDIVDGLRYSIVPLRLIRHDTGFIDAKPRITIRGRGYIVIMAREPEPELEFFALLGERKNRTIRFDERNKMSVFTDPTARIDPPLDINGHSSLAFYSTDIEEDARLLIGAGGRNYTGISQLRLDKRIFEAATLRSPEGTIIELVRRI